MPDLRSSTTLWSLALVASFTAGATAQKRGALSSLGQGIVTKGAIGNLDRELLHKRARDQTTHPMPFTPATTATPDYSLDAIFSPSTSQWVEIDAMSTGNALLPVTRQANGTYTLEPLSSLFSWVAVMASVEDGPHAGATGVFGQRRAAVTGGLGADVFSYWFEGNQGLEPGYDDEAYLQMGIEHLQMQAGADVRAVDMWMPIIHHGRGVLHNTPLLMNRDEFYFSLTPSSVSNLTAANNWQQVASRFATGTMPSELTAATVFLTRWSNGAWGRIGIMCQPGQIGLPFDADIDGLDVQPGSWFVFSLPAALGLPQFLIGDLSLGTYGELRTRSGGPVHDEFGFSFDTEVDAVCIADPESSFSYWFGTPRDDQMPGSFELSVARSRFEAVPSDASGQFLVHLTATGVPLGETDVGFLVEWNGNVLGIAAATVDTERRAQLTFPVPGTTIAGTSTAFRFRAISLPSLISSDTSTMLN